MKKNFPDILFCGHSTWEESYGYVKIPAYTFLYVYAPLGSALSQSVVRAVAAGEQIQQGDLQYRSVSPITLFNYGYPPNNNFNPEQKILASYPLYLKPGDIIENFKIYNPGKDRITEHHENIEVVNIQEEYKCLSDLLREFKGEICHFGACHWVKSDFNDRNIVTFANSELHHKYKDPELDDDEKKQLRMKRFQ